MVEETKSGLEATEMETAFNMEFEDDRFRTVEVGQVIEAKVILVRDDEAYVDIGGKSDMVIPLKELAAEAVSSAKEVVKPGDIIKVMVVKAGGEDGVVLSKRRVDQEKVWEELAKDFEAGTVLTATVKEAVKGGLSLSLKGIRAFMPASQSSLGYQADLSELVGQDVQVKIIEFNAAKRRVVVSRRVVLEELKQKAEAEFYEKVEVGQRMQGKVTRITPFGAFVDLGAGVEGLIHISELSWHRVKSVDEVLKVGQTVEVVVIKVDAENKKISLSLKQIQTHPWVEAIQQFSEGQVCTGEVTKLEPFGAFVRIAPHVEGLVHISQISEKRIGKPDEVLKVGDQVTVKILRIDYENRKVSLSIKQVASDAQEQEKEAFLDGQDDQPISQNLGEFFEK